MSSVFSLSLSLVFHLKVFELICLIFWWVNLTSRLDFSCRFLAFYGVVFFFVCFVDAVFLCALFSFHMNFRSKPRVVCPDIASGLFSRKPSRMESWTKQWLYLVLIQITSTDAAASGSDKLINTQTWAVFSFLSQHTELSCHHVHPNMLNFNLYGYQKLYICR